MRCGVGGRNPRVSQPIRHVHDSRSGRPTQVSERQHVAQRLGAVELPGATMYGMSSWVHDGKQYVIIQLQDGLAAMAVDPPERSAGVH